MKQAVGSLLPALLAAMVMAQVPELRVRAAEMPAGARRTVELEAAADGWYTWRIEAVDDAPAWCCYGGGRAVLASCNLDSPVIYGDCGERRTATGVMQIFAKIESGEAVQLRTLAPECEVGNGTAVSDLGDVAVGESLEWLRGRVGPRSAVSGDALAAIAVHRGEEALRYLTDVANAHADGEARKEAVFWLGQVRIGEASADIERLMFADDSPDMRQHAAFALSQSKSDNRTGALIRQGRSDADPEVRSHAWFWLAQTGASEAGEVIAEAIGSDPDRHVREEAVFALSQLPQERAVDALLNVLENRALHRSLREKALFWLAQSESDRAFAVLERLLVKAGAGASNSSQ